MSKKKHLSLRFTSALLCMTILTGGMAANWTPIRDIPVSAKTLAELQEERKSNEKKIAEKQKELDSLQSDLEEKEAYQKTLQEKISEVLGTAPMAAAKKVKADLGLDIESLTVLKRMQYDAVLLPFVMKY